MPLTVSKTGEVSDAWLAVAFAALSGSETEREWSTAAEMPKSTTTAPAAAKGSTSFYWFSFRPVIVKMQPL